MADKAALLRAMRDRLPDACLRAQAQGPLRPGADPAALVDAHVAARRR